MSWFGGGTTEPAKTEQKTGSSSLYDRYAPSAENAAKGFHSTTRSAQLRAGRVRLNCYLNLEGVGVTYVGGPQGHGTIVMLPMEIDTLEEVLQHVQLKLDLDKRMCYCADLFLPDGKIIDRYEELVDNAKREVPIIIGCGEPFDGSRVPQDLLEFYLNGGGRTGVKTVITECARQRFNARSDRAESVRQDGHGLYPNSLAVVQSRTQAVEANREKAAMMRQRYLEGLVRRNEEDSDYLRAAQQNIMFHKMEEDESRMRREDWEMERMERLNAERKSVRLECNEERQLQLTRRKELHDKVKEGKRQQKEKVKAKKEQYKKDARVEDFGTRPGQVAQGPTDHFGRLL